MLFGLFGDNGGITEEEVDAMSTRDKFSDYLPWVAYDPESHLYVNIDETVGYIWECAPIAFATTSQYGALQAVLRMDLPKSAVVQFLLYADPHIKPILDAYGNKKTRDGELNHKTTLQYGKHLYRGTEGMPQMRGIPVRNFRAFVTVKSPEEISPDTLAQIEENLTQARMHPVRMPIGTFLGFMRRLLNPDPPAQIEAHDPNIPIRKQVIMAQTAVQDDGQQIILGPKTGKRRYARCLTPKLMPKTTESLTTNQLAGSFGGVTDDDKQITSPFLWSVSVLFESVKGEISRKLSATSWQKSGGSFAHAIAKRIEEFNWAQSQLDNERFLKFIPSVWVFGDDEDECRRNTVRAKSLWETDEAGYLMQEEEYISKSMFITAMPFGLYNTKNNIKILDRDFYAPVSTLVRLLPVQADFAGNPANPALLYIGRKGQLIGIDVFDDHANNHNFFVVAGSGGGKSFSLNFLCDNYFNAGSLIRIVDLGGSYKKLCRMKNGRYVEIDKRSNVVLNPWTSKAKDAEDAEGDLVAAASVVGTMVYSATGEEMEETEHTLLMDAVRFAHKRDGGEYGVNHVQEYLGTFPKYAAPEIREDPHMQFASDLAHKMAFNLKEFTTNGHYGQFFNGKTTVDVSQDEFVVLELEQLMNDTELFKVITRQILNAVTQDLYLSDRTSQRFILFEEAWAYLTGEGSDIKRIVRLVEEGYRRARKYTGSFGMVTQSPLDFIKFGRVGDVIKANSAFKFYLESGDYEAACENGCLDYEGLARKLLKSTRNNKPRYSEMFLDTPFGMGVARLCVDPWNYWVNTSAGKEVARFEALLNQGMDPVAALSELSGVE